MTYTTERKNFTFEAINRETKTPQFRFLLDDLQEMVEVDYPMVPGFRDGNVWVIKLFEGTQVEVWQPSLDENLIDIELTTVDGVSLERIVLENVPDVTIVGIIINMLRRSMGFTPQAVAS